MKKLRTFIKYDIGAGIFAVFFTAILVCGILAKYTLVIDSSLDAILLKMPMIVFEIFVLLLSVYFISLGLFTLCDLRINKSKHCEINTFRTILKTNIFKYILIFILCWIPYLIIRFPGNLDPDTLWQVLQTEGLFLKSDHHPWFDTCVFGTFWNIGLKFGSVQYGLLLYSVFQYIVTSISFAVVICYMIYIASPKWVRRSGIAFFALYPVVPIFAESMMKDTLFGWVWVLFFLCYVEMVRTRGRILSSKTFIISISAVLSLIMLTKKTGIYIIILSFILLLVFLKKNRLKLLFVSMAVIILYLGVWNSVVLPLNGVEKGGSQELMSVPSQQTACYLKYYYNEVEDDEWIILEKVFSNPHTLAEIYNPTRADATKALWIGNSSSKEKKEYYKWWLSKLIEHPILFIDAAVANSYSIFYPDCVNQGDESLIFYRDNIASNEVGNEAWEKLFESWSGGQGTYEEIHKAFKTMYRNPIISNVSNKFNYFYLKIMNAIPLLFSKVLFATWIPLFVLCYLLRKRNVAGILCMVPTSICWLTLIAGPIIIPRYMVSFIYTTPIMIALLYFEIDDTSE